MNNRSAQSEFIDGDVVLGFRDGRRVWRFPDGTVVPYVAGGEGPAEMPSLPEDLSTLTDEQVGGLEGELLAFYNGLRPNARTAEDVTALSTAIERVEALRNEAAARYTAAATTEPPATTTEPPADGGTGDAPAAPDATTAAALAELDNRLAEAAPPAGDAGGTTEPAPIPAGTVDPALVAAVAGQVAEAVGTRVAESMTAALGASGPRNVYVSPGSAARYMPPETEPPASQPPSAFAASVVASTTVPGFFEHGQPIPDSSVLAEAMAARWNQDRGKGDTGAGERITIAHLTASADEDRILRRGQDAANFAKVAAYMEQRSLTAAGGLCAPRVPIYDQPVIATADRPFRAGFPTFLAERGGVTIVAPPTMADIVGVTPPDPNPTNLGDGVGTITIAQDAAGTPLKTCLDVPCKGTANYDVEAIYRCLQFAVLGARVFPEQVTAYNMLATAVQAQKAETLLLDAVSTVAHQKTFAKTFGTARQLLAQLEHAAAHFRNVNRMSPEAVVQVRLPAWALNAMRADLTSSFHDDPVLFSAADAVLEGWFRDRNLAVGYYIDSATGKGQMFAAIGSNGSAFPDYPNTVVSYMWADGTFLLLDQGTLDLGIVRDSTLVAQNRFRDFSETWEGLAWTGLPVYEMTHTVSSDGSYGAALAITAASGDGL